MCTNYLETVVKFARAAATARVLQTTNPLQNYAQAAYRLGVDTDKFRDDIDKLVPDYIVEYKERFFFQ